VREAAARAIDDAELHRRNLEPVLRDGDRKELNDGPGDGHTFFPTDELETSFFVTFLCGDFSLDTCCWSERGGGGGGSVLDSVCWK